MMRRVCTLAVLLAALSGNAYADDRAQRAADLFDAAQEHASSGDFATACQQLADSQRLDPQLGTLLHLAHCLEKQGKTASAWLAFREALAIAEARNASGVAEPREDVARRRAARLEPLVSKLHLEVAAPDATPIVECDGRRIPRERWAEPLPVDPGLHTLRARAPGRRDWDQVVAIEQPGTRLTVRVPELPRLPQEAAPPLAAAVSTPSDAGNGPGAQRIWAYALGGAGAVALGLGIAYGVAAENTLAERESLCPNARCTVVRADADRVESLTREANDQAQVANIAFAMAVGLVATGTILYLTAPDSEAPSASLAFTPEPGLRVRLEL